MPEKLPYTHDPRSRNRRHNIDSIFWRRRFYSAGFSYHMRLEWKFLAPKINMAESATYAMNS